ncbi:hypothetical protein B0J14DRAFT_688208 [Halenospora varia]|nr:hypothetical protein B0J14DRAFT_688208 [Halenospora varia]
MPSIRDATSIKDIHISLGQISNDLAELEVDLANVAKARRTFSNIHQAQSIVLGQEHPITLSPLLNQARHLLERGKCADAIKILRGAAEHETSCGPNHETTISVYQDLAISLMEYVQRRQTRGDSGDDQLSEAKELWTKIIELYNSRQELSSDFAMSARLCLGITQSLRKDYNDAWLIIRDVHNQRTDKSGEDHPSTLNARMELALVRQKQKLFRIAQHDFECIATTCESSKLDKMSGMHHKVTYLLGMLFLEWGGHAKEVEKIFWQSSRGYTGGKENQWQRKAHREYELLSGSSEKAKRAASPPLAGTPKVQKFMQP